MDDLISRQAAIDAIGELCSCTLDEEAKWREIIGRIPSAQQEQQWIPIKTRPMSEEERREHSERFGYDLDDDEAVVFISPLPDNGQLVLVSTEWGDVAIDEFYNDPYYGCYLEGNGDMDGIVAWMPLPEPYKKGE